MASPFLVHQLSLSQLQSRSWQASGSFLIHFLYFLGPAHGPNGSCWLSPPFLPPDRSPSHLDKAMAPRRIRSLNIAMPSPSSFPFLFSTTKALSFKSKVHHQHISQEKFSFPTQKSTPSIPLQAQWLNQDISAPLCAPNPATSAPFRRPNLDISAPFRRPSQATSAPS